MHIKKRILIVEDEGLVAADLEDRVMKMGYDVVGSADSGRTALSVAHCTMPDLALCDLRIKGPMDGIETAEELQYQLRIPVIFLTAHADDSSIDRAKAVNAVGYLIKPVRDVDLRAAVEVGCSLHQLHSASHRTDAWLHGVIEHFGHGVITVAPNGKICVANAAAVSICRSELVGYRFQDIGLRDRNDQPFDDLLATALMQSRPQSRRGMLKLKDESQVPVRYIFVPITFGKELLGTIVILHRATRT